MTRQRPLVIFLDANILAPLTLIYKMIQTDSRRNLALRD